MQWVNFTYIFSLSDNNSSADNDALFQSKGFRSLFLNMGSILVLG